MRKLFGTDGIRGVANIYPMDVETVLAAGKAIAVYFRKRSAGKKNCVLIGQDTRRSGAMLVQAAAAGACAAGADVGLTGILPTPGIAYLARSTGAMAGIVISASHNPFEDNGIKVFDGEGYKLPDEEESAIEELLQNNAAPSAGPAEIGCIETISDAGDRYLAFLRQAVQASDLKRFSIVLDCANGATYQVAPQLFRSLGASVSAIGCAPDGLNINDRCGSQYPEELSRRVVAQKAHLGLAFDGDGDRLIAVDETGRILSGDQIMAVCAIDMLNKGRLKNNVVVSTVMSNMGFSQTLQQRGIALHRTQVGDRYVMEKMRQEDAVLGGEDSGHMIFMDAHTTGDGLLAALRLLEAMFSTGKKLSELARQMTFFPQKLINVDVIAKPAIESVPEISRAVSQVQGVLADKGRVLVRYSGTQNLCRIMVEGPSLAQTQALCEQLADVVRRTIGASG